VDFDAAFVAFLNGVEIARAEIGWPGKTQNWNDWALADHHAQMHQGLPPDEFKIEMDIFNSLIHEGDNILAIQAFNGYANYENSSIIPFLSFGIKDTSHLYQSVPEWFEKNPVYFHTNFALDNTGESVILSNSQGIIDLMGYQGLLVNNSYGHETDESTILKYFAQPTPGIPNGSSPAASGYTKKPLLSLQAGFYPSTIEITILNHVEGDTIRFTRTGAIPVDTSEFYTGSINIDTSTVIRARVFKNGLIPGKMSSNTYFIGYTSTLPVISIGMDPYDLWDWEEGIYVMGPNADPIHPHAGANFWMDWKKPIHIEYFDSLQNKAFALEADIMINGGFSRALPQKSLRLIMSGKKYDEASINYQFFNRKDINSFKRLIFRNSGQDFNNTQLRDAFMSKLVQGNTNIDIQDYQPTVVFLNGQYWGIQNIRERIDRYYINSNIGVSVDSVQLLKDSYEVMEGNNYHYLKLLTYISSITVVDSVAYDSLSKLVDIENYTDYFIAGMFFANTDWPRHNTKYWRKDDDTSRWRHIQSDTDFGFGLYSNVYNNELYKVLHSNIPISHNHKILRKLITNPDYRKYFINRSADIFNTALETERMLSILNFCKNRLYPEIPAHTAKWGGDLALWEANVDEMFYFAEHRHSFVYQHYIGEFDMVKTVEVGLDIDSVLHGHIKINTIVPDSLPWHGVYFDGNPIEITAIADSGYVFSHWASNPVLSSPDTLNPFLQINVDTNSVFKAFFVLDTFNIVTDTPLIVFSEINYNSSDSLNTGDWVEILNADSISHDISDWVFKDGDDGHSFIIPGPIVIDTNSYLVLCRDTSKFFNIHTDSINVIGPFEFGLAASGENIRLFNSTGSLVVSTLYSNEFPWPQEADGTGRTLELINPNEGLNNPSNWFAGCFGGSPGEPYTFCDTVGISELNKDSFEVNLFPNPFYHKTQLELELKKQEKLKLQVFDIYGNLTEQNIFISTKVGKNSLIFRNNNLSKGIYFYRLSGKSFNFEGKMIIK